MKYLVFSDSHGNTATMQTALAMHPDTQGVIFLGDGLRDLSRIAEPLSRLAVVKVRGNCDGFSEDAPTLAQFTAEGVRIAVMHGHEQQVKYTDSRLYAFAEQGYDLILHGHTHIPREEYITAGNRRALIANPGSAAQGRFAILTLQKSQFLISLGVIK